MTAGDGHVDAELVGLIGKRNVDIIAGTDGERDVDVVLLVNDGVVVLVGERCGDR
jgi:hypothetical protein